VSTSCLEVAAVQVMLVIPLKPYKIWLARVEPTRPEYRWLTNGVIVQNGEGQEVQIPCDDALAQQITGLARREIPEILPYMKLVADRPW
jgi:hypothetical protein